ncbi:MAG: hypothetical protein JSS23_02890 [Proteobacteria bacterium]|nr:hypothetical protein [Pseudomonadota bacterium]
MALDARPQLQKLLAASPMQRELSQYLRGQLEKERDQYEAAAASEFSRGRINMLRDVIDFIEDR